MIRRVTGASPLACLFLSLSLGSPLGASAPVQPAPVQPAPSSERPNIVFVFSDDHAAHAIRPRASV